MQHTNRIIIFCDWYEPATKAGGPIISMRNLVNALKDKTSISVFTADRDINSDTPFADVEIDKEIRINDNTSIEYLSPKKQNIAYFKEIILSKDAATIHINSMFSFKWSILPMFAIHATKTKNRIILSPRGMLSREALQIKSLKKKVYLTFFKWMNWHKNMVFHSTSEAETLDLKQTFGDKIRITQLPNFSTPIINFTSRIAKDIGQLNIIYFGRIFPIKNIHLIIESLSSFKDNVTLTICGPIEDKSYWETCLKKLEENKINYTYLGEKSQQEIQEILAQNHVAFLPSKSENFGHAIIESLKCGLPVITSNNVPWKNLIEHNCGFNVDPENVEGMTKAIAHYISLDNNDYLASSKNAIAYAQSNTNESELVEHYLKMYFAN